MKDAYESLINNVYIPHFNKVGEAAIPGLVNGIVSKKVLLWAYKKFPPIEEMWEQEKREMKQFIIELFPNKTTVEKLEACKIVYTLGNLL